MASIKKQILSELFKAYLEDSLQEQKISDLETDNIRLLKQLKENKEHYTKCHCCNNSVDDAEIYLCVGCWNRGI